MATDTPNVQSSGLVSVVSALFGLCLKGQIFKADGEYSVSIPGGRNFGGIFAAELETAAVNGRQVAISGSYDADGLKKMEAFEATIKGALLNWLKDPAGAMLQSVSFDGKTKTKIRFAKENSTNPKAPIAAYYLSL
jgi:hypothetical protein